MMLESKDVTAALQNKNSKQAIKKNFESIDHN